MISIPDLFKQKKQTSRQIKPVLLLVLDGWGIAPASAGNAISQARTPNYDQYWASYPHGELIAAGESVGLPANEEGNSEVGHLTLGTGRVISQSLKRINVAIEEGSFFENEAFLLAANHARKFNSKLHLMGLVGSGEVHSSMGHFYSLLDFCQKKELVQVCLHLFTDGRDAPPKEGIEIIGDIERKLEDVKIGRIATISGRYFAMDRDRHWERTQKAYEAIVLGKGLQVSSGKEAVKFAYDKGQTDEFIEPTVIIKNGAPVGTIGDNDAVIFFNFRIDRPRQLAMAFVLPDFERLKSFELGYDPYMEKYERKKGKLVISGPTFKREKWPKNLFFATMTEFQKELPVGAVAFPPVTVDNSLTKILSDSGLKQLHIAESEKERMVTFYFRGMKEEAVPGEDIFIVPSPRVSTYDKKPEMSVFKLVRELKKQIAKDKYHFFVMNIANSDMVAHSGDIKATIRAIEVVDRALGEIVTEAKILGGTVIVTADHGNAEELITYPSTSFFFTTAKGDLDTGHSRNPVPVIIINSAGGGPKELGRGALSDVAPTILSLMGLSIPPVMTGRNLLK